MKTVVLLGSKNPGTKNDLAQMQSVVATTVVGATIRLVYWEDVVIQIKDGLVTVVDGAGFDLKDAALVFSAGWYKPNMVDFALSVASYLSHHNVELWNSEMAKTRSKSKLSAMVILGLGGVPVPDTLCSLSGASVTTSVEEFPVVAKAVNASRGTDNYLVESEDALGKILTENDKLFIVQKFVENKSDLRIICANSKPVMVIERTRTDGSTHLNNVSQGATAAIVPMNEIDPEVLEIATRATKLLHREVSGVDILLSVDRMRPYLVLEVNALPQLTSGSYVTEKMQAIATSINEAVKGN